MRIIDCSKMCGARMAKRNDRKSESVRQNRSVTTTHEEAGENTRRMNIKVNMLSSSIHCRVVITQIGFGLRSTWRNILTCNMTCIHSFILRVKKVGDRHVREQEEGRSWRRAAAHLGLVLSGLQARVEVGLGRAEFGLESRHFAVERLRLGEVLLAVLAKLLLCDLHTATTTCTIHHVE